jgi:tetratricopeptide (TPR) repeat protein
MLALGLSASAARANSETELLHLESELSLTTWKFDAHDRLSRLAERHPSDARVLANMGVADERLGRWRQSLEHYERSLAIDPESIDTLKAKSYLHALEGPHLRLDQWYRDTSNQETQWISRIHAREFVTDHYTVGATYEHRYIEGSIERQRFDGTLGIFEGHRNRYEAYVERAHDFASTRLSLLGQEETPGAALAHIKELPVGRLLLRGAYHDPYWVLVEALADEGTADRLEAAWIYEGHSHVGGEFKGPSPVTGSIGTRLNRYGLDDDSHVAESLEILIELRYRFLDFWPGLSVGYGFDAEYASLTATRTDINGDSFHPLPLQSTQVHSWDVSLSHDLTHHLHFDLTTGFSYDNRIDASRPFVYGTLIRDTLNSFQLGLNFEFNQESNRGINNTFTQFGGFLVWRF